MAQVQIDRFELDAVLRRAMIDWRQGVAQLRGSPEPIVPSPLDRYRALRLRSTRQALRALAGDELAEALGS